MKKCVEDIEALLHPRNIPSTIDRQTITRSVASMTQIAPSIRATLVQVSQVCDGVNEAKRRTEQVEQLLELQHAVHIAEKKKLEAVTGSFVVCHRFITHIGIIEGKELVLSRSVVRRHKQQMMASRQADAPPGLSFAVRDHQNHNSPDSNRKQWKLKHKKAAPVRFLVCILSDAILLLSVSTNIDCTCPVAPGSAGSPSFTTIGRLRVAAFIPLPQITLDDPTRVMVKGLTTDPAITPREFVLRGTQSLHMPDAQWSGPVAFLLRAGDLAQAEIWQKVLIDVTQASRARLERCSQTYGVQDLQQVKNSIAQLQLTKLAVDQHLKALLHEVIEESSRVLQSKVIPNSRTRVNEPIVDEYKSEKITASIAMQDLIQEMSRLNFQLRQRQALYDEVSIMLFLQQTQGSRSTFVSKKCSLYSISPLF